MANGTEKRVKITLPLLDGDRASQEVFVSVNFKAYRIRRGVEAEVPECVAEALKASQKASDEEIKARAARSFREPTGRV